jgi:hypothetical protein
MTNVSNGRNLPLKGKRPRNWEGAHVNPQGTFIAFYFENDGSMYDKYLISISISNPRQ